MRNSRQDGIYSQEYIIQAMDKLLRENKIEDITVTDICKKAGVARVTFYKYYHTINDVMQAYIDVKIKSAVENMDNMNICSSQDIVEHIVEGFAQRLSVIKSLIDSKMSSIMLDYFNYAMEEFFQIYTKGSSHLSRTEILFLSGGIFNVIIDWIKTGSKESPQSVAKSICEIFPKVSKN